MQRQNPQGSTQQRADEKAHDFFDGLGSKFSVGYKSRRAKFAQCVQGYSHATCFDIASASFREFNRVQPYLKIVTNVRKFVDNGEIVPTSMAPKQGYLALVHRVLSVRTRDKLLMRCSEASSYTSKKSPNPSIGAVHRSQNHWTPHQCCGLHTCAAQRNPRFQGCITASSVAGGTSL